MAALRPVHFQKLAKVFEMDGFVFSQQAGDHLIYTKAGIKRPLVIPMYRPVPVFVIMNLLRTARITRERFFDLLGRT